MSPVNILVGEQIKYPLLVAFKAPDSVNSVSNNKVEFPLVLLVILDILRGIIISLSSSNFANSAFLILIALKEFLLSLSESVDSKIN